MNSFTITIFNLFKHLILWVVSYHCICCFCCDAMFLAERNNSKTTLHAEIMRVYYHDLFSMGCHLLPILDLIMILYT